MDKKLTPAQIVALNDIKRHGGYVVYRRETVNGVSFETARINYRRFYLPHPESIRIQVWRALVRKGCVRPMAGSRLWATADGGAYIAEEEQWYELAE